MYVRCVLLCFGMSLLLILPHAFAEAKSPLFTEISGSVALKNNYVFSTGTEIDDKPVLQFWTRATMDNGIFLDFWANAPLSNGNPNRSGEMDFSIGFQKDFSARGVVTAMLSYYDIQTPDLLDFSNDVVSPLLKWQKGNFYVEGIYFFADGQRNGFRVVNSYTHQFNDRFSLYGNLNYADGPFQNQSAIISKLGLQYKRLDWWINSIGIEVNEVLSAEDDQDPRGSATTLTLTKHLF